jgi:hypothetical protein
MLAVFNRDYSHFSSSGGASSSDFTSSAFLFIQINPDLEKQPIKHYLITPTGQSRLYPKILII